MREGALTIAYNAIVWARALARQAGRPTEMGVRALVPRGHELLLVRHRGGSTPWSLPGGGIYPQEPLADAARREVAEEAGCTVAVGRLLGLYHSFGEGMNNYVAVFVCAPLGAARPPVGDLEIVDARFFDRRDLPATIDPGSLRRIAEHDRGGAAIYGAW
jgi:ADP-ribose pyrophosphatase YjhB (NUDIX family)